MAEFEQSPTPSGAEKFSRRTLLKGIAAAGLSAAGFAALEPQHARADAGDEIDTEVTPSAQLEALRNLQNAENQFIDQDREDFEQQFDACPKFEFYGKPTPPRNFTFMTQLRDGSKAGVVIGDVDDPSIESPHLGVITPLFDSSLMNGADSSLFRVAGKPLETEDLVVEFRSADPEYHEKHGKVYAHFGELGIADGNLEQNVLLPARMPTFKGFSGKDDKVDWMVNFGKSNLESGPVVFDIGNRRNSYERKTMDELVEETVAGREDSLLCAEFNSSAGISQEGRDMIASMADILPPLDMIDPDYAKRQMDIMKNFYKNVLQKLPLAFAAENSSGFRAYQQLAGTEYRPVDLAEIFHGKYEQETYDQIIERIPSLDLILSKPFVTAEDIIRIPPVTLSNLIRYR